MPTQPGVSNGTDFRGQYTANVLGTIRSHLEALQGFDVMAIELIQNADDAGATDIIFDVTDDALVVSNSGRFSYCGDLQNSSCPGVPLGSHATKSCDFHNIVEVASGAKLGDPRNIGRFGVGFISTYQVTDSPQILSGELHITLHPDLLHWSGKRIPVAGGTRFTLPWATDQHSAVRTGLCLSAMTGKHIERVVEDVRNVLENSLLFLRNVKRAQLLRNGILLFALTIDRPSDQELRIAADGASPAQDWLLLRASAADALPSIIAAHPILATLKRTPDVTIAIRVAPSPLDRGRLYAYLPTQQPSALPAHINGDFFPNSSRKAAIFEGHQHQQTWNEALIGAAAEKLSSSLELLRDRIGHVALWELIKAAALASRPDQQGYPDCYTSYWSAIETALSASPHVVLTADGDSVAGSTAVLSRVPLREDTLAVAKNIGLVLVSEKLRPFTNWLPHAGVSSLTLDRVVSQCEESVHVKTPPAKADLKDVGTFYAPLWGLIDTHAFGVKAESPINDRLRRLPLGVATDLRVCSLATCFTLPPGIGHKEVETRLPWVPLAHFRLLGLGEIVRRLPQLSLGAVLPHLERESSTPAKAEILLGSSRDQLKRFYSVLVSLAQLTESSRDLNRRVSSLPIWRTGAGFASLAGALLPGDFADPIGASTLLDAEAFDARTKEFLQQRLGIRRQSIRVFIQDVLPRFFQDGRAIDLQRYQKLMVELSNHGGLLDDEQVAAALAGLALVPTQDGGWHAPSQTYFHTDILEEVLGDVSAFWVDESRLPPKRSVRQFLTTLGIRTVPSAADLVSRVLHISEAESPSEEPREASARAFYAIGDQFGTWAAQKDGPALPEVNRLRTAHCLPADRFQDEWFRPTDVYAPYRAAAFESQAKILSFKNTQRLNRSLLDAIGVKIEPPTSLVIAHLRHCRTNNAAPSDVVYQVLNERAVSADAAVKQLADEACIYDRFLKRYLLPSRVFWSVQRLGRYAHTAPANFDQYRAFLTAVGVRAEPEPAHYASILVEIVSSHYEGGATVEEEDLSIYLACLRGLSAEAEAEDSSGLSHWKKLVENPTVLNLRGIPRFPDEALLLDSEWIHSHFGTDIDELLCRPSADYVPLLERLGVRRLSALAKVELDLAEGQKAHEAEFEVRLRERADCVSRLLHDKDSTVRTSINSTLKTIEASSFDQLKVVASVALSKPFVSEERPVQAFYEADGNSLTLARPVGPRSWPQAFNALFHHFLSGESGADISKLSAVCWNLVQADSLADAHQYLTDIGIPDLVEETETEPSESAPLDGLGEHGEPPADEATGAGPKPPAPGDPGANTGEAPPPGQGASTAPKAQPTASGSPAPIGTHGTGGESSPQPVSTMPAKPKKRPGFKQRYDQALRTYVRPKTGQPTESDAEGLRHRRAVEAASRKIVCDWELKHGRQPEELEQGHPGYDIVSTNPRTGEQRLIEVKGIDGEWNRTGVGVTRTEFSNAQHFGGKYWLYVVEWALDPASARVRSIKNPATRVEEFMFDSGWKDLAEGDQGDPKDAFVPGARGEFGMWGKGTIVTVERKTGGSVALVVNVDGLGPRTMTLNLQTMKILGSEDADGDDDS